MPRLAPVDDDLARGFNAVHSPSFYQFSVPFAKNGNPESFFR
jgi:hypothetical protein